MRERKLRLNDETVPDPPNSHVEILRRRVDPHEISVFNHLDIWVRDIHSIGVTRAQSALPIPTSQGSTSMINALVPIDLSQLWRRILVNGLTLSD